MSKKDEKAPGISENHVISADNKEKSELFNSFYSHLQGEWFSNVLIANVKLEFQHNILFYDLFFLGGTKKVVTLN